MCRHIELDAYEWFVEFVTLTSFPIFELGEALAKGYIKTSFQTVCMMMAGGMKNEQNIFTHSEFSCCCEWVWRKVGKVEKPSRVTNVALKPHRSSTWFQLSCWASNKIVWNFCTNTSDCRLAFEGKKFSTYNIITVSHGVDGGVALWKAQQHILHGSEIYRRATHKSVRNFNFDFPP